MKKISVASLNRFSDALSTFPNYKTLTNDAIKRILKAFENEKVLTLAFSCVKLDYAVSLQNWKTTGEKLQGKYADAVQAENFTLAEKLAEQLHKHAMSKPFLNTEQYYLFGYIVQNFYGVSASTVVPASAWRNAFKLRSLLYSPLDYAIKGKEAEVNDRLTLFTYNGQTKTVWSEFSAHKAGKKDITDKVEGLHYEKKTGVGDWYTSKKAKTLESMRRELERKVNDRIRWDYVKTIQKEATKTKPARLVQIAIHFEKTWAEFFQILENFNGDIGTWFKPIKTTENGYLLQMQEIQTSEKKIAYLMQYNDK